MKRSEMIHAISDNVLSSFLPEVGLQLKNLIADCMLAEVEKLGMKPPTCQICVSTGKKWTEKDAVRDVIWLKQWETETTCKDCGQPTAPGKGSAHCPECWKDKTGQ
jgi:predicted Zn-ribbon and HTH transcriptional regulator